MPSICTLSKSKNPDPRRLALLSATALTVLALAGCVSAPLTTVQKNPSIEVPDAWAEPLAPRGRALAGAASIEWWRALGSPELDRLIRTALSSNRDLSVMTARVTQARALIDGAQAERRPQVGGVAGAQRGRDIGSDPKVERTAVGLRASWEVDLFGRGAMAVNAATADAQGAAFALDAARIALVADVAIAYFELRTLGHRLILAKDSAVLVQRQVEVARRKLDAGQATALDIERWTAELAQERASIVQLDGALRVRQRQLALLLGTAQTPSLALTQEEGAVPSAPVSLLPAELLERRPDVQRQARALDAALGRVGVARRDVYPRLSIDWAGSRERLAVIGGSASPQMVVGYGVSLSVPLFDGGRIRANIAVHEARAQEAMAEYEKSMLAALVDAEVTLAQWSAAQASLKEWHQAQTASETAQHSAERLFDAGMTDLSAVLDARRNQLRAQDALSQAEGVRWAAAISLRRVFAGSV